MKPLTALIGIVLAGFLGYLLEPAMRQVFISAPKPATVAAPGPEVPKVNPPVEGQPIAVPAWVKSLTPEQLPDKVTLMEKVEFSVAGSTDPMIMPAGAPVTPVRMEGELLVISPFGGPIEGRVSVAATDLVKRLGNKPPEATTVATVDGSTVPAPTPPMPEPEPEPEPDPEPVPEPEPVAGAKLTEEQIVALMQESIKGGSIKEFTFDQVLGWKSGEDEERDGQKYQTGVVAYKAETIFGVKNIQAQALIKDGKIVSWIWPKSGMEIR